jgi:hypothetical protein
MQKPSFRSSFLPAVLSALLPLAGCDQPPLKELAAAESALAKAREAGAEGYAVERLREAESALAEARRKAGDKDYRGALSSATEAAEKARGAAQAAAASKTLARSAAEVAVTETEALIEDALKVQEEALAAKPKVPEEAFADCAAKVEELRAGLENVGDLLAREELLAAQRAAEALKAQATPLPALFQDARAKWEEEHPQGRRAPRR